MKQDYGKLQNDVHKRSHTQQELLSTNAKRQEKIKGKRKRSSKRTAVAWKGFALVLFSCLCSAANSMAIKKLAGRISAIEIAFFRQLTMFVYLSPPLVFRKTSMIIERKHAPFISLWVITSTTSICCSYYALEHISAGDAVAIIFSAPIFTGIIAWIFLREKLTLLDALFVVLTIVGIILIARPSFIFVGLQVPHHGNMVLGVVVALASTLCTSVSTVLMRKLGKTDIHPFYQLWVLGMVGSALIATVASIFKVWSLPQCGMERIIIIISCCLALGAHIPLLYAVKVEKAVNVAMFRTNMVIFTFIFEFAIFGTIPFYLSLIGTGLIILSSLATTLKKWIAANQNRHSLVKEKP